MSDIRSRDDVRYPVEIGRLYRLVIFELFLIGVTMRVILYFTSTLHVHLIFPFSAISLRNLAMPSSFSKRSAPDILAIAAVHDPLFAPPTRKRTIQDATADMEKEGLDKLAELSDLPGGPRAISDQSMVMLRAFIDFCKVYKGGAHAGSERKQENLPGE